MSIALLPGERLDDLQTGGLRLIQRPGTFCFGTDTVLLADFSAPRPRDRIVDLGCGNGAIALLLAGHRNDVTVDAVEIQPQMADMASRSVRLNHLEDRIQVHCCDMREAWRRIGREKCSLVVCNPPYGGQGTTIGNIRAAQRIARHEADLTPEDIAAAAASLVKYGGRFCVVYPSARVFEMMAAMDRVNLTPKRLRSVHARIERPPKLVLLEGVKGGGSGVEWMPPLILYENDGSTSREWRRIYGQADEDSR